MTRGDARRPPDESRRGQERRGAQRGRGGRAENRRCGHSQGGLLKQFEALLVQIEQLLKALNAYAETNLPGGGAAKAGATSTDAGEPLRRMFASDYDSGFDQMGGAGLPGAREISNAVSATSGDKLNKAGASDLFWLWGQFLDHDIDLSEHGEQTAPIDIPEGDATFDPDGTGAEQLGFRRSQSAGNIFGAPQQINSVTALIDGSNIYGSTQEKTDELRSFEGGKLRTNDVGNLPENDLGFYEAGDVRANENIALTSMHTLFMREHNRVADALAADNPEMTDQEIFDEARAQVTATLQSITVNEFLPIMLGGDGISGFEGHDAGVDAQIANAFSTAAYRFGHSMVSDTIPVMNADGSLVGGAPMALSDVFFRPDVFSRTGPEAILRGLASQTAQAVDPEIVDSLRNMVMDAPGAPRLDLASLNLQRGRDHGLPPLNDARTALGMPRIESFDDPVFRDGYGARLASVYDSPDDIELWVGLLAEAPQGEGLVGPTQSAILGDQFQRLRDGDANWYENRMDPDQVADVNARTLADVIADNTGFDDVQAQAMLTREAQEAGLIT